MLRHNIAARCGKEALERFDGGWEKSNADLAPEDFRRRARELLARREECDSLRSEFDAASVRVQRLAACLEPLRQFAKQAEAVGGF